MDVLIVHELTILVLLYTYIRMKNQTAEYKFQIVRSSRVLPVPRFLILGWSPRCAIPVLLRVTSSITTSTTAANRYCDYDHHNWRRGQFKHGVNLQFGTVEHSRVGEGG